MGTPNKGHLSMNYTCFKLVVGSCVLASFPPSLSRVSSSSENVVMEMDFTLCGGFSPRLERGRGRRKRGRGREREGERGRGRRERGREREREEEGGGREEERGQEERKGKICKMEEHQRASILYVCYVYTRIQEGAYKVLPTNFPSSTKLINRHLGIFATSIIV